MSAQEQATNITVRLPNGRTFNVTTRPHDTNNGFKPEWVKKGSTDFAPSKNQPGQRTRLHWADRGTSSNTTYSNARNIAGMVFATGRDGDPSKGTGCITLEEYERKYGK